MIKAEWRDGGVDLELSGDVHTLLAEAAAAIDQIEMIARAGRKNLRMSSITSARIEHKTTETTETTER